jgi:hypothetical protein
MEHMRRIIVAMGLMLALASITRTETASCTTRYDDAFKRWVTECSDGARAITRYDEQFKRYQTDIITPPKGDKLPHGWPMPGKRPQ